METSEDLFHSIVEIASDAIVAIDSGGKIIFWNRAAGTLFGYSAEEIKNKHLTDLMPERFRGSHGKALSRAFSTGQSDLAGETIVLSGCRQDGSEFPLELSLSPWKSGEEVFFTATIRDVTKRKPMEEALKESEQKLSTTLMSIGDAVIATDAKGIVTLMNPIAEGLTGWEEAEAVGKPLEDVFNIINEQTKDQAENPVARVLREGVIVGLANHTVLIAKDGTRLPIDDSGSPIRDEEGNIIGTVMVFRDITERRRAEERYRELANSITDIFFAFDMDLKYTYWNKASEELTGISAKDAIGKSLCELFPDNPQTIRAEKVYLDVLKKQQPQTFVNEYQLGGKDYFFEISAYPSKEGISVFTKDITERKQAQEALKESEAKYRLLIDGAHNPITVYSSDGTLLLMNVTAATKLGGAPDDFVGKSVREVHPGIADMAMERIRQVIESKESREFETMMELPSGKRWFWSNFQPVRDASGKILAVQIISSDITERKWAEEALRESEGKYRAIFEQAADSIVLIDAETGELIEFNDRTHENLGYTREEFEKLKIPDFEVIESFEEVTKHIEKIIKEGFDAFETKHRTNDGEIRYILVNSRAISIHGKNFVMSIWRDITEHKQAEEALQETQEKLIRAERLAVLGQLAGGVGHELRNPLGAIKNAAYFLNMVLEEPEPEVKETLEILEQEVGTSERITSSLLDFARPKPPKRRRVNLNKVVLEALFRAAVPENVKVVNQLDEALPTILVDPDQLDQVFGNIIFNGIQAMPEGGRLTFKSEAIDPKWVTVSFTDTGEGIPDENLEKLYEPLFTTRARGIGLGLALARTLVVGHGGTIEVESKVGKGSTFTVWLPVSGEPATDSSTSLGTNSTVEEGK